MLKRLKWNTILSFKEFEASKYELLMNFLILILLLIFILWWNCLTRIFTLYSLLQSIQRFFFKFLLRFVSLLIDIFLCSFFILQFSNFAGFEFLFTKRKYRILIDVQIYYFFIFLSVAIKSVLHYRVEDHHTFHMHNFQLTIMSCQFLKLSFSFFIILFRKLIFVWLFV